MGLRPVGRACEGYYSDFKISIYIYLFDPTALRPGNTEPESGGAPMVAG